MPTKKPAKGTTSTALTKWEEQLAAEAKAATDIEANVGTGQFIGTAGGILKYKGAAVPENKMNVIIVDHILVNLFYEGKFDPGNPAQPVCFAFGRVEDELKPHENSVKPQVGPGEFCSGCPNNEWGSADTGRGKAVKNSRRLGLISEGDLEDIEAAEVAYLQLPPTSIKGWAGYVRQIADTLKRPPFGVITEISLVPDPQSQFKINFKLIEKIEDAPTFEALFKKRAIVTKEIEFPYVAIENAPKKLAPARRRGAAVPTARTAARPAAPSNFGRKAAKPKY